MVQVQDEFSGESRNAHWNRLAAGSAWVEESFGCDYPCVMLHQVNYQ